MGNRLYNDTAAWLVGSVPGRSQMWEGVRGGEVDVRSCQRGSLNTEGELDANVDVAGHLDDLGELHRLLGGGLQVVDGEDLEAGVVELGQVSVRSCGSRRCLKRVCS